MSDEQLVVAFTKVEDATTKSGKRYTKAWDGEHYPSGYPCWSIWDDNTAANIKALAGQQLVVKVNRDNADFPKVTKFIKVGDGTAPVAATPPSPAAASHTAPTPAAAAGSGSAFKRDPLGVMLNLRQTALNCATTWIVSHNEKLPGEEKLGTTHLMKCAEVLFRHLVRGVEDSLPIPHPGPQTQDNGPPDDGIPF